FKVRRQDLITTVTCPPTLDFTAGKEFDLAVQRWLEHPGVLFVLDFDQVNRLDLVFIKSVGQFKAILDKQEAHLCTTGCSNPILRQITSEGLQGIFSPVRNVAEYMKNVSISFVASRVDPAFVDRFVDSTVKTIEIQANTPLKSGKFYKVETLLQTDLAVTVEIETEPFRGTVALCFPKQALLDIYFNMLGERYTSLEPPVCDCAAELLNIISGLSATALESTQKIVRKQPIPRIISSVELAERHHFRSRILVMPFFTESGTIHLEISTETYKEKSWTL
ncbi:MAG: chemotaxis protein CheX, partial [Bdellovibrionota bacterium]